MCLKKKNIFLLQICKTTYVIKALVSEHTVMVEEPGGQSGDDLEGRTGEPIYANVNTKKQSSPVCVEDLYNYIQKHKENNWEGFKKEYEVSGCYDQMTWLGTKEKCRWTCLQVLDCLQQGMYVSQGNDAETERFNDIHAC